MLSCEVLRGQNVLFTMNLIMRADCGDGSGKAAQNVYLLLLFMR
jgi:hypothetical protein